MTDTEKRLEDEVGKAKGRSLWEDQKAWSEAHKHADELVYKNNAIYSAIYYPPIRFMGRDTNVIADSIQQAVAEERTEIFNMTKDLTPCTDNSKHNLGLLKLLNYLSPRKK